MAAPAATDIPSLIAEIKARVYANRIGAVTAIQLQQLLVDMVNVLDVIAIAAGGAAGSAAGASAGALAGSAAGANAAVTIIANGIGSSILASLLAYPQVDPGTPGALWWDGGVLVLNPGMGLPSSANPLAENLVDAEDVQTFLLGLPTSLPALPGRLWWDGAAGSGSVLAMS